MTWRIIMNSYITQKRKRLIFFRWSFSYSPFIVRHLRMICSPVMFNSECGWTIPRSKYSPPAFNNRIPSLITVDTPHTYDDMWNEHGSLKRKKKRTSTTTSILFASSTRISAKRNENVLLEMKALRDFTHSIYDIQVNKKMCTWLRHAKYIDMLRFL